MLHGTHSSVSIIKAITRENKRIAMFWIMLKPLVE
jgi:hypothetical protein